MKIGMKVDILISNKHVKFQPDRPNRFGVTDARTPSVKEILSFQSQKNNLKNSPGSKLTQISQIRTRNHPRNPSQSF